MKRSTLLALGLVVALLGSAGLAPERIPYDRDKAAVLALGVGIVAYGLTRG